MKPESRHMVLAICATAFVLSAWVMYNVIFYQDWRCSFARCVRVENVKP